jgi:hypothetical protein
MDLEGELFSTLSGEVTRQIKRRKLNEKEDLEDFASWREEGPGRLGVLVPPRG